MVRNTNHMTRVKAIIFAPMWIVYNWNVVPWFRSTPRELANRANAIGVMAGLIGLLALEAWLFVQGEDVSSLPKSGIAVPMGFVGLCLLLAGYFTKERFGNLMFSIRNMTIAERRASVAIGISLYASFIVYLILTGKP